MKGYVYVLTNDAMPGLVKIGRSKNAAAGRAAQMYSGDTGVPLPFEIAFECMFDDCIAAERQVHLDIEDYRINPNREFFKIEVDQAIVAVMRVRAEQFFYVVEYVENFVGQKSVNALARELDCHPFELIRALEELNAGEARPALDRMRAKDALARAERAPLLKLVDAG